MSGSTGIDVRGVTKIFGGGADTVRALDQVSVAIRGNEFFTLLGPSGCGKTTLLRLIAGFEQPSGGDILLEGSPIGHLPPYQRPVNTVFQSYALFPHMTVSENVAFGLEMRGIGKADTASRVAEMLDLVKLSDLGRRKPAQLSGGQQQRVALARALANNPKVLLLDEPLSALDLKLRKEMQVELKRIQHETGILFIFVTHDQGEALTMSDRIAVMSAGRILQVGAPTEIYEHPTSHFVAGFIGETNFLQGEVVARNGATARVRLGSGAERQATMPAEAARTGKVSLAIRPERVSLAPAHDNAALAGRVENVVYIGTDSNYHLVLEDGGRFVARLQNRHGAEASFATGDQVAVEVDDLALQVLRD